MKMSHRSLLSFVITKKYNKVFTSFAFISISQKNDKRLLMHYSAGLLLCIFRFCRRQFTRSGRTLFLPHSHSRLFAGHFDTDDYVEFPEKFKVPGPGIAVCIIPHGHWWVIKMTIYSKSDSRSSVRTK